MKIFLRAHLDDFARVVALGGLLTSLLKEWRGEVKSIENSRFTPGSHDRSEAVFQVRDLAFSVAR